MSMFAQERVRKLKRVFFTLKVSCFVNYYVLHVDVNSYNGEFVHTEGSDLAQTLTIGIVHTSGTPREIFICGIRVSDGAHNLKVI